MTERRTPDRDVNRAIRSWLHEDRHEDVSRVAGAVLDQVETIPQRRATWWPAWRTPIMNKVLTYGLGAAAVVVIGIFLGAQLLGSPTNLADRARSQALKQRARSRLTSSQWPRGARPVAQWSSTSPEAGTP